MLRLTAASACDGASSVAARLLAQGLVAGDRIAIAPSHETDIDRAAEQQRAVISAVWGSLSMGVIPVMVNPDLSLREREYILRDSNPSLMRDTTDSVVATHPTIQAKHV